MNGAIKEEKNNRKRMEKAMNLRIATDEAETI